MHGKKNGQTHLVGDFAGVAATFLGVALVGLSTTLSDVSGGLSESKMSEKAWSGTQDSTHSSSSEETAAISLAEGFFLGGMEGNMFQVKTAAKCWILVEQGGRSSNGKKTNMTIDGRLCPTGRAFFVCMWKPL